jgi:hypothetical protein
MELTLSMKLRKFELTTAATLATAIVALGCFGPVAADARAPKKPGKVRVDRVSEKSIKLRWKDRAKHETGYRVRHRQQGESKWKKKRLPRNRKKFKNRGLDAGTLHEHQVRACDRKRCSGWSPVRRQATLLAPFGGPHPGLGACDVFPRSTAPPAGPSADDSSAWNQDISAAPVHPRSDEIIDQIAADGPDELHPDFGENPDYGIPYVVVPGVQPDVSVRIGPEGFPDESDFGPAPLPPRAPIEAGSDHHALVVDRDGCQLYELYLADYRDGTRNRWRADSTAFFDLTSTALRPDSFTSADAAGLPIFAGLVRHDEVASGRIDHAIRVTFDETRQAYIHPATHHASDSCNPNRPAMGMRLRLRPGYDISGLDGQAGVIAVALKRYGMIVADNGSNFFITGATDSGWNDENLNQLKDIPGSAFEVVRSQAPQVTPC